MNFINFQILLYLVFGFILLMLVSTYYRNKNALFYIILTTTIVFLVEMAFALISYSYYVQALTTLSLNTSNPFTLALVTAIFTHYNYLHIISNMVILLLIGMAFEDRVGARTFTMIYMITGIAAGLIYSGFYFGQTQYLLGASGAIFGIMGAFLIMYPNDEIPMLMGFIFLPKIKVKYVVLFYAALEFLATALFVQNGVAHFAHVSGFVVGVLIAVLLKHRTVKPKVEKLDLSIFNTYSANNNNLEKIKKHIENENITDLRNIWIEKFFSTYFQEPAKIKGKYIVSKHKKLKIYK